MDIQTLKAELEKDKADLKKELDEIRALKASLLQAPPEGGMTRADLIDAMKAVAEPATAIVRKLKPENAEARKLGPFEHPEGGEKYPKPPLAREVWFGCVDSQADTRAILRQRTDDLTYFEVEALNTLSASLSGGQRRMCRDGKWRVFVTQTGDAMHLMVPIKNPDDRADLPSFLAIVKELTTGERMPDAADMAAQLALLEQKVKELSAAKA